MITYRDFLEAGTIPAKVLDKNGKDILICPRSKSLPDSFLREKVTFDKDSQTLTFLDRAAGPGGFLETGTEFEKMLKSESKASGQPCYGLKLFGLIFLSALLRVLMG